MTNLDSILKSRDIILPTKVRLVKAMVFHVVLYGCESWTVKKAERQRIDAFELWCWIRLLRVPCTARRSTQSILKEISPGCSLEGLMLKLKLHYFGHLMRRVDSLEKTLMLGGMGARGEGDDRGWDGWMASVTRWTWVWANSGSWWWTAWRAVILGVTKSQTRLSDWTELNTYIWNLEKWYWRIYLQGNNWEPDIENRLMDMGRGEERVRCMKRVTWKLTSPYEIDSQWEFAVWLRKLKQSPCLSFLSHTANSHWLYGSGNSNRGSVAK